MTINPNARLVTQECVRCEKPAQIIMLPLCAECLPKLKDWDDLKRWKAERDASRGQS